MAAAATHTFYQDLTREQAEAAVRLRPDRPILRPCSYTPSHPSIRAVTYRGAMGADGAATVQHSLVELSPTGHVYEIEVHGPHLLLRTHTHDSVEALEVAIRQLTRRLWLHASSIRADEQGSFPLTSNAFVSELSRISSVSSGDGGGAGSGAGSGSDSELLDMFNRTVAQGQTSLQQTTEMTG
jgi:hypothetical protein